MKVEWLHGSGPFPGWGEAGDRIRPDGGNEGQAAEKIALRWGADAPDGGGDWILNPAWAARLAADWRQAARVLRLYGLAVRMERKESNAGAVSVRKLVVPVFHLRALALFEGSSIQQGGGQAELPAGCREVPLDEGNRLHRRAARTAITAIYALGLDYGCVLLEAGSGGGCTVIDVRPFPRLQPRLNTLFAEAAAAFAGEAVLDGLQGSELLLGADPEFLLHDPASGKVVSASRYLSRRGPAGCDSMRIGGKLMYPLAELRPKPSGDPVRLTAYLRRTMELADHRISQPSLHWLAGGMPVRGFPLGGHIHLSGIWLNSRLLRALDNYLALPLALIEAAGSRRRPRYGFPGDFRRQPHGGFEYRTLPSWLASPQLAAGVFALARLIAIHYPVLKRRPLSDYTVLERFMDGDKRGLLAEVEPIWADLARLDGYGRYARPLEYLRKLILELHTWDEQADIRKAWGIKDAGEKGSATQANLL